MDTKKQKMTLAESYLTVAQAAEHLGVHPSTIRRWIDSGLLRAYRLGRKRIALKLSDVERVVARRPERPNKTAEERKIPERMTKAQQQSGLKALAEIERFAAAMAAKYGKLEPESWVLINEARDERTRQLMEAIEGRKE